MMINPLPPCLNCREYCKDRLAIEWREWLAGRLTAAYFANRAFYQARGGLTVSVARNTSMNLLKHNQSLQPLAQQPAAAAL